MTDLARFSFGAPLLFEPDEYRKGSATREPADLAWVGRDTLFLMNMQESRSDFNKQYLHNVKQLRGFLRIWDGAQRLQGHNEWNTFDIPLDEVQTVVFASIVEGSDARCIVHRDLENFPKNDAERRVAAVVSIPAPVLLELARLGGSALDLADLILRVNEYPDGVSEFEAIEFLKEHYVEQREEAESAPELDPVRDPELDRTIQFETVAGLRSMISASIVPDNPNSIGPSILNDLDWHLTKKLCLRAADVIRNVRDVPVGGFGPRYMFEVIELRPYTFLVGAFDARQTDEFGAKLAELTKVLTDENPKSPPISMSWMLVGRPAGFRTGICAFPPQKMPTTTGELLRSLKS